MNHDVSVRPGSRREMGWREPLCFAIQRVEVRSGDQGPDLPGDSLPHALAERVDKPRDHAAESGDQEVSHDSQESCQR